MKVTRSFRAGLLFAALLVGASFASLATPASAQTDTVKLMVLGETHGTRSVTKSLVNIAASKGATGCVCPGDFIYGHWETNPWAWRDMMKPFMGNMMPAQGNHDWPWSDWSSLFPGGKHYYAKDVNGVQFIALNTEYSLAPGSTQRTWLDARLSERDDSALKVVFMHRPWWLPEGARHPMSEFQAKNHESPWNMFSLMERHGVDLVVSAHEKNYQHSTRNGVHYLVAGGGGPDFYGMGYSLPGAVKRLQANVVSTLDVTPTSLTIKSYDTSWNKVEEFTMTGSGSAPAPAPTPPPPTSTGPAQVTFRPHGGNEWWVQTSIDGAEASRVTKVDARVTGGAWNPLAKRSWGAWAASFHVPSGQTVQFQATLDDGRTALSCTVAHPGATCVQGPSPPPSSPPAGSGSLTWDHKAGNEWWVQVAVGGADAGRVAKVESRDDGGSWVTLPRQSWGDYAGSYRVEPGHLVHFRATLTDGSVLTSCAFTHPAGVEQCGAAPVPPPASGYAATFSNPRGNDWWVEVDVTAPGLARVEASVNGGAWVALSKTSWGSWAKSVHAPSGASVQFRATGSDGASATSATYAWPPK